MYSFYLVSATIISRTWLLSLILGNKIKAFDYKRILSDSSIRSNESFSYSFYADTVELEERVLAANHVPERNEYQKYFVTAMSANKQYAYCFLRRGLD